MKFLFFCYYRIYFCNSKADIEQLKTGMNQILEKFNNFENSTLNEFNPNQTKIKPNFMRPGRQEPVVDFKGYMKIQMSFFNRLLTNNITFRIDNDLPLQTIANLSKYLLSDLRIRQTKSQTVSPQVSPLIISPENNKNLNKESNDHNSHLVTRNNEIFISPGDNYSANNNLFNSSSFCSNCANRHDRSFDALAQELGKRIEVEVAKGKSYT